MEFKEGLITYVQRWSNAIAAPSSVILVTSWEQARNPVSILWQITFV